MLLNYANLVSYLKNKGWSKKTSYENIDIWTISFDEEMYHISIPETASENHYKGEVISILSHVENRSDNDILADIIK